MSRGDFHEKLAPVGTPLSEDGTTSHRYTILGRLAGGGMADIFLARARSDAGVERHVVLKRVLAGRSRDPDLAKMFLDEARLAAQLDHPNIAQVHDIGTIAGAYFFTMEYIHGEDARHVLYRLAGLRRVLPIDLALHIATGALAALHHAHEQTTAAGVPLGLVHRDVTPSNVMVAFDGAIKLLDFGVAQAASPVERRSETITGKIAYLSPEQCQGDALDRRSDLFSLGIVLYEMLTCRRLYRRDTDFATMAAIVEEAPPPPSRVRSGVSPALDEIVMTALAKDPARRFATAAEMLGAIETVAAREHHALSAPAMATFMRALFGHRPEPWVALGLGEPFTAASDTSPPIEAQLEHAPALYGPEGMPAPEVLEQPVPIPQVESWELAALVPAAPAAPAPRKPRKRRPRKPRR